jgi:pyridinium-3,5-biscarboxylic acid mononucleotide sulfurtransferase
VTPPGGVRVRSRSSTCPVRPRVEASGWWTDARERRLLDLLATFDSLIIAFSGGADSAYLGVDRRPGTREPKALCITADSPSYPEHHRQLASRIAREFGLRHELIRTSELDRAEYRANPVNRCYHCKHELYTVLTQLARRAWDSRRSSTGATRTIAGTTVPGRVAAREFGVRSPLDEAGLTKADIRELSRRAHLPTWDEPASACLSSRIPYHSAVTVRQAAHDRAGRARAAGLLGFASAGCVITTSLGSAASDEGQAWRDSSSGATSCRARSS